MPSSLLLRGLAGHGDLESLAVGGPNVVPACSNVLVTVSMATAGTAPTTVRFRTYGDEEILRYLEIEKPYDCAGSAKIESLGIALVERVESTDPTALIGLPLIALVSMLKQEGIEVP